MSCLSKIKIINSPTTGAALSRAAGFFLDFGVCSGSDSAVRLPVFPLELDAAVSLGDAGVLAGF